MTDNEIIKALECCADDDSCNDCGFVYGDCNCGTYRLSLMQHALSLINRQKAEKEALIAGQETLQKYIAAQKAEIERLVEHTKEGIDLAKQLPEMLKLAQAEAIKYFAERLKRVVAIHNGDMWSKYEYIDNLVKEMVGDDNENV